MLVFGGAGHLPPWHPTPLAPPNQTPALRFIAPMSGKFVSTAYEQDPILTFLFLVEPGTGHVIRWIDASALFSSRPPLHATQAMKKGPLVVLGVVGDEVHYPVM